MKFLKRLIFSVLISLVLYYCYDYLINNYLLYDRHFISHIDRYNEVHKEIEDRNEFYKEVYKMSPKCFYRRTNELVSFTISEKNISQNNNKLVAFFNEDLSKQIVVLKSGEIFFNLKSCDRFNCINLKGGGYHGDYVHFLSKDELILENTSSRKMIHTKKLNSWYYYVIWYSKG